MPFPVSFFGRHLLEPWWLRAYRNVPALTVSESSAESLRRYHGWRDLTVVPEGYTPHPISEVAKEPEPTAIFVGRLVAMKRPEDAIEAIRLVAERVPQARLWIVGDGPMLERLWADAPAQAEFLGRLERDELLARLARAHVLVATAVREGWGLTVSEAAACGTPSIGYAVPGLLDSIPASGGALVDPAPAALADALARFFTGALDLDPVISTVPWSKVASAVEDRLTAAVR
jgi:glycosyltransferase involved in cell wall biosynthesis